MFGARFYGRLLFAALGLSMLTAAQATTLGAWEIHREAVDEQRYPWSAVGKLFTEGGSECSGVLVSPDKILTAAHCLFNYRTGHFITPDALHFLVGYRTGRYSAHARIARYEVGPGFDPLRYEQTSNADWAVLTATEKLPAAVEPLRLSRELAPSGTKAVLVGYPQDRAYAMTADRDCELREKVGAGRLLLHTCRGVKGTSGGPVLVRAGGDEMQIAGIQIASSQSDGATTMIAVPAQAIWLAGLHEVEGTTALAGAAGEEPARLCQAADVGEIRLTAIHATFDIASPAVDGKAPPSDLSEPAPPAAAALAWLALEPFAIGAP
jgi:protease YdgD